MLDIIPILIEKPDKQTGIFITCLRILILQERLNNSVSSEREVISICW